MDVDDSIDAETLQARIDMSMSFAQDLVTSWIKPSNLAPRSTRNVEEELKEHMRRPPRLGVGAPIPESASASRDAASLKQRLTSPKNGKKRTIQEVIKSGSKGDFDDDGEESRTHAIRKKVKASHPEPPRSKSQNGHALTGYNSSRQDDQPVTLSPGSVQEPTAADHGGDVSASPSRPKNKKKRRRKGMHSSDVDARALGSKSPHASPPASLIAHRKPEIAHEGVDAHHPMSLNTATTKASSGQSSCANEFAGFPKGQSSEIPAQSSPVEDIDRSLVNTVHRSGPRKTSPSKGLSSLLQGPLLNLTGPPADDHEDGAALFISPSSPSKKRRRRRKKKHSDANHAPSLP